LNQEKIKPLTLKQWFIVLALFLTPVLVVVGIIWGIAYVIKTPEYKDLYPMQGILVSKKLAGGVGTRTKHYYRLRVNVDGEEFTFSLGAGFISAYRKLQLGDKMKMLVKRKKNIKTKQQRIYELKVNGETLVKYDSVVRPSNNDSFSKIISFVLLGVIIFFILIKRK